MTGLQILGGALALIGFAMIGCLARNGGGSLLLALVAGQCLYWGTMLTQSAP